MAIGVNSQTRPVQQFQTTQQTGFAQAPQQQQGLQQDPMAALSKALEALEQAVSALTSKGFNNNQSVASQATQNLGTSGNSTGAGHSFDFSNLFQGGSTFDAGRTQAPTPPVQENTNQGGSFLDHKGGGGGNAHINFGNDKSGGGGGTRVDPGSANNRSGW